MRIFGNRPDGEGPRFLAPKCSFASSTGTSNIVLRVLPGQKYTYRSTGEGHLKEHFRPIYFNTCLFFSLTILVSDQNFGQKFDKNVDQICGEHVQDKSKNKCSNVNKTQRTTISFSWVSFVFWKN